MIPAGRSEIMRRAAAIMETRHGEISRLANPGGR